MPQFAVDTYASQCFWFVLCFVVTVLYTIFISLPKLHDLFDERWKKSGKSRLKAQRVQQQVETLESKIERIEHDADIKKNLFLRDVIINNEKEIAECMRKLRQEHKDNILSVEKKMSQHKEKILCELLAKSDHLSNLITERVITLLLGKTK